MCYKNRLKNNSYSEKKENRKLKYAEGSPALKLSVILISYRKTWCTEGVNLVVNRRKK